MPRLGVRVVAGCYTLAWRYSAKLLKASGGTGGPLSAAAEPAASMPKACSASRQSATASASSPHALLCRPHSRKPSIFLPCHATQAGRTCARTQCCERQNCMDCHTVCTCHSSAPMQGATWQQATRPAAEAPQCGRIRRSAPPASQALVICPHAFACQGEGRHMRCSSHLISQTLECESSPGIAYYCPWLVFQTWQTGSSLAKRSGWLTSPAGRLDNEGVDVRCCGGPRHVPGGRACQGGGVQVGAHVRHVSVEGRQILALQPGPQLVAQPGVVIAQLLHLLRIFRPQGKMTTSGVLGGRVHGFQMYASGTVPWWQTAIHVHWPVLAG